MSEFTLSGAGEFIQFAVFLVVVGGLAIGGPVMAFYLARESFRESNPQASTDRGAADGHG